MHTERFKAFMPFILKWETVFAKGHYGDFAYAIAEKDPDDPGGLTKFGIDKASHESVDIEALTLESATEIYWREWVACGAETFPLGLGEAFFNACVNCGVSRAHKLQHDPAFPHSAKGFIDAQEDFYKRLAKARPSLAKFLKGWLKRTADLRRYLKAGNPLEIHQV